MVRKAGLGRLGKSKTYYQYNYVDVVKKLVPSLYEDTDSTIFGQEEDILYSMLGKILLAAKDCLTLIPLSTTLPDATLSGLQQHFIPKNDRTNVQPYLFEKKILKAFGKKISDFETMDSWGKYVSGTLLGNIKLNEPSNLFVSGVSANVNSSVSSTALAHQYLIDNLSWLYFLNFDGPPNGFNASAVTKDLLVSSTYVGKSVQEVDGVKGLFEYLWRNKELAPASGVAYLPPDFNQTSAGVSANIYASGTQLLEGIKTLIGVWYNPNDDAATELQTQLELLQSLGTYSSKRITAGPFQRFLKALSFAAYDVNSLVDDVGTLIDIDRCDQKFLNYLGSLIGWKVLTGDVDRWRGQLRQAVHLYKAKGTRKALETAVSLMFPGVGFNAASATTESWESYFPRLIYYLIATDSKVLNDPNYNPVTYGIDPQATTVSFLDANSKQINAIRGISKEPLYDSDDHDNNYRFATDYVLSSLQGATSAININGVPYDPLTWDPDGNGDDFKGFLHRGALVPVPPWENDRFYDTTFVNPLQLQHVSGLLVDGRENGGLEVPREYVKGFTRLVLDENINSSLMNGLNLRWKFFTPSSLQPPNLDSIVTGTKAQDASLKDYWNSKASTLFTVLTASSLIQDLAPGVSGTNPYKASTEEIVFVLSQIFRQFIPFHSVVKFFVKDDFEDRASIALSGSTEGFLYAVVVDTLEDTDDQILRDFILSGYVASAVSGLQSPSSVRIKYTGVPRTSRRRRNLKYIVPAGNYYRDGNSMPIARSTGASGFVSSVIEYAIGLQRDVVFSGVGDNYMNVSSFIPLGYNFSTGNYFSTKGSNRRIYDASNDLGLCALPTQFGGAEARSGYADVSYSYYGVSVSSTYPCRALGYVSSINMLGPITRSNMDYSTCALYGTVMRSKKTKDIARSLATSSIDNVSLGASFWDIWNNHQKYFGGSNFNYTYDAYSASGAVERFARAGGRSMGAQVYGPGFFNSNLSVQGHLAKGDFGSASAFDNMTTPISQFPQWKNIVANEDCGYFKYKAFNGDVINIDEPTSFSNTWGNSRVKFPDYLDTETTKWAINSVVSGVNIVGDDRSEDKPSWAVYNTQQWGVLPTSSNASDETTTTPGNISLFNEAGPDGDIHVDKTASIHLRYSLNQGRDYLWNSEFRWKSASTYDDGSDTLWRNNRSSSGIAGWALQAANTSDYKGGDWVVGNKGNFGPTDTSGSVGWFLSGLNTDTDQYYLSATVSGTPSRGHPKSVYLRCQSNKTYGGEGSLLFGLIPGRQYKLVVEYMTRDADASGVLVDFERQNPDPAGTDMRYNRNGGWTVGGMPFHQICPVLAPGPNTGLFNTCSLDINVSSTFMPGDRYDLKLSPVGPRAGDPLAYVKRYARYFFKKIELREVDSSPTKSRLIPEKDYELSIRLKHDRLGIGGKGVVGVRIRVDNIPILWDNVGSWDSLGYDSVHAGYKGKGNTFAFDIVDQQWKNIVENDYEYWTAGSPGSPDPGRLKNLYYEFDIDNIVDDTEFPKWKLLTIPFNTKNAYDYSPDQWVDYSTRQYQPFIYKSGKPLHNVDTVYHVEIGKFSFDPVETNEADRTFLTIDEVSFKLSDYYGDIPSLHTYEAVQNLIRRFDLATSGSSSRNSYYSASAFQTSGGARISYEEEYGNIYSGTVDTTNTYGDTSGVVYTLTDD